MDNEEEWNYARKNGIYGYESWECFHLPPPVLCKVTQFVELEIRPSILSLEKCKHEHKHSDADNGCDMSVNMI